MELLPSPVGTLAEFLANEQELAEGMTQQERYDMFAASTRIAELNRLVENGVASEAQREELVHRMTHNPQFLRMIEAGRDELRSFLDSGSGDASFVLNNIPAEYRELVLNGDIETLARVQVESEYLKGAVANNMATSEEIAFNNLIERGGIAAFIANPKYEMLDLLENPENASIEPHEMLPGFEGLAGTLNTLLDQFSPMLVDFLATPPKESPVILPEDIVSNNIRTFNDIASGPSDSKMKPNEITTSSPSPNVPTAGM